MQEVVMDDPAYPDGAGTDDTEEDVELSVARRSVVEDVSDPYALGERTNQVLEVLNGVESDWSI